MKRVINRIILLGLLLSFSVGCAAIDEPDAAGSLPDRQTATYAVLVGTLGEKYIDEQFPNAQKLPFDSINDAVLALLSDKADYVVSAYTNCLNFVRANPGKLAVLPDVLTSEGCAVAVNKNETALLQEIDRVIEQLRQDGTLERTISNWIREDGSDYIREEIPLHTDGPVLCVAVSAEREPMCFVENGKIVGLDAELIQRIAYELGMRVEFSDMKFAALIPSVLSGKTPVAISNVTATAERRESVSFSTEYFLNPQTILTRAEFIADSTIEEGYTKLSDLAGKRIGAMTGTTCEKIALSNYPNANYASFTGTNDMMAALKAGKLDYCVMAEIDAVNYMRSDAGYRILPGTLGNGAYSIAVAKGNGPLLGQLNALLEQYTEDGTLARLKENWIRPDGSAYVTDTVPAQADGVELRVALCSGLEPSCFIMDGELAGFDVELMRRLAYDLGYQLTFVDMDFSALVAALESGRADVAISGIAATEERAKVVDFTHCYYEDPLVLVRYKRIESKGENFLTSLKESFRKNFLVESRWKLLLNGIGITLLLSVCSGIAGIVVGFLFCLMRMNGLRMLKTTTSVITRMLQGTPIVVLLMILYYIVFSKSKLDGIVVSIIAFGLNFGAYASEIILSGINAVDKGQRESAYAIGFTPVQTFLKIIFPQAARHFLPVLKGEYISLVKMTSIVGYVAVQDLTKVSDIIRSRTYEAFFPLIVTAVIYFLLSYGLSSLLGLVEIRIDPKHRPRTLKGVKLS